MKFMQYPWGSDHVAIQVLIRCVRQIHHQSIYWSTNQSFQGAGRVPSVILLYRQLPSKTIRDGQKHYIRQGRYPNLLKPRSEGDWLRPVTMEENASMRIRLFREDAQEPVCRSPQQVDVLNNPSVVVEAPVENVKGLRVESRIVHGPWKAWKVPKKRAGFW